ALEKTPADRFQTMRDFSGALADAEADAAMQRTAARRAATGARRVPTREIPAAAPSNLGRNRAMVIGGVVAALLIIGGGAWAGLRHRETAPSAADAGGLDAHRVAVLYFDSPGGSDSLHYLADGLTEGLIRQLSGVQTLDVISPNGVAPYRSDSIPRDSVARALNVGTLVQGGVERSGGRVRVTVRLIDGASGVDYKRASVDLPAANVLGIQDSLVQKVAELIRQRLGEEIKVRQQHQSTTSAQAWILVQRAQEARKRAETALTDDSTGQRAARGFEEADSLYGRAQAADPRWAEPLVGRATLAYRRSRAAGQDPVAAKGWIDKGVKFADSALALSPQDPDALEARGTLRYWAWLLRLEPDPVAAKKLLADAQADLEMATKVRPAQAGAWAILSHLYNQTGGETDAKLAARRAYEEDAYLSNADQILSRLFLASYDLEQFVDAVHYCEEGHRRFPSDFKFVSCRLWLMTTKAKEPDVDLAWKLADSTAALAPPERRAFETLKARMAVAAVLARKGLPDSARHVASRSRGGPDVDPTRDLVYMNVFVQTLLNDHDEAIKSLKTYLVANPGERSGLAEDTGWWFRGLQDDPKFKQLVQGR
ncbi:MAG TPA: hypothetical protein VH763_11040, partial [Gemmatimonadales bacterium]